MITDQLHFVPRIHHTMQKHRFLMCYRGFFSQDVTLSLLSMMENKLSQEQEGKSVRKKVFHVMMECLQSISSSSVDSLSEKNKTIFLLGKNDVGYFIFSGKLIPIDRKIGLQEKLQQINDMSTDELRLAYTDLLTKLSVDELSASEVGMINIARRSGRKLDYDFAAYDDSSVFFSLKTDIVNA
ncbi:MAG: SiaB family protein kinase [Bacteroidia bacterium]